MDQYMYNLPVDILPLFFFHHSLFYIIIIFYN